ncbi:hypothetical protein AAFP30_23465 [Gordonia sp. CPCC 205515]
MPETTIPDTTPAVTAQMAVCAAEMNRLGVAKQRDNGKTKARLITL